MVRVGVEPTSLALQASAKPPQLTDHKAPFGAVSFEPLNMILAVTVFLPRVNPGHHNVMISVHKIRHISLASNLDSEAVVFPVIKILTLRHSAFLSCPRMS